LLQKAGRFSGQCQQNCQQIDERGRTRSLLRDYPLTARSRAQFGSLSLSTVGDQVKQRFRMFVRAGGIYYWQDCQTRQQGSLGTRDKGSAQKLLHAKNESFTQPILNLALAKAYASAHDPKMATRVKISSTSCAAVRIR
jgi:hypothetical protein